MVVEELTEFQSLTSEVGVSRRGGMNYGQRVHQHKSQRSSRSKNLFEHNEARDDEGGEGEPLKGGPEVV